MRVKFLLACTLLLSSTTIWALDAQQIFERVSPSIVVIKAGNSQGSGVVYSVNNTGLTPTTFILTNCHVVKDVTQVTVERLGKKATGNVKTCDEDRDMAVVTLGGALPNLQIRKSPLKVGEPAFAVGAPQGLELSISQGIVSQLRKTDLGNEPMIQTTAAISQGSSGGGLFDSEGRLIGLTTLYYKDGQSLNFAVPISFVTTLKNTAANRATTTPQSSGAQPRQQQCGWSTLGFSDRGFERFIDYCKVTGKGRYRFAWTLHNYKDSQKISNGSFFNSYSYSSEVMRYAYDCQLSRSAIVSIVAYQSAMASGSVVSLGSFSLPENEWEFNSAPPGSVAEALIDEVCK